MFDAKKLLDSVFGGPNQKPGAQAGGGLDDLLRNLGQPAGKADPDGGAAQTQRGGLEDMLRNLTGGGGSLSDILSKIQTSASTPGGVADTLRQVLGQAMEGTKEGAGKIGEAVGARDLIGQLSGGRSPDELMAQLKQLIADNQLGSGAALGGLGALVLGTGAGRSLAFGAAKLGALALVGGLAYKAYQNYSQGRSPLTGAPLEPPAPAPQGSGFEPAAISNDSAALYLRAMIAAAAADGRIDDGERAKILSSVGQSGVEKDAAKFLERELTNPASAETLAAAVTSPEEAARVYTAARIVIDPDTDGERGFLADLATKLDIDDGLAAHIDATTKQAA